MLNGYVEVEVYANDLDGEIAKGLLAENGIEALISKDDCGGMMPNFQLTRGVRIYVLPKDVEKSENLLKMLANDQDGDHEDPQTDSSWLCANCGEALEQQFTDCWKCGPSRDSEQISLQDV